MGGVGAGALGIGVEESRMGLQPWVSKLGGGDLRLGYNQRRGGTERKTEVDFIPLNSRRQMSINERFQQPPFSACSPLCESVQRMRLMLHLRNCRHGRISSTHDTTMAFVRCARRSPPRAKISQSVDCFLHSTRYTPTVRRPSPETRLRQPSALGWPSAP
jgi:hypothetical protein